MSDNPDIQTLISGLKEGNIVPYLGAGVLNGSTNIETGEPIPADSDSLIIAMNNGVPMSAKLMYEFPRAAMNIELKRGRKAVHNFLDNTYGEKKWTRSAFHQWLASIKPHYVIDLNRDLQLQETYADTPHTLIRGISRIAGTNYRFSIHHYDDKKYSEKEIDQTEVDTSLPVLFKALGSPLPDATYIASDADFVDYITELMGGFAIPDFLKSYRINKQYLFLGLRMLRDTERMILSDMIYSSAQPSGWAVIANPTDKEKRFCKKQHINIIDMELDEFLASASSATVAV